MPEEHRGSGLKSVIAGLTRSAEYSIALALLAVCLVVGGAVWLLDTATPVTTTASTPPQQSVGSAAEEEQAAIDDWKRQLQGSFSEIERQQRRTEEEARERQRAGQERADRERLLAERAEAARRSQEVRPAPAPVAAARTAVRVGAAIDWSSCSRPVYPKNSVRRQHEGVVSVAVDLDTAGQVRASRIAESSGHPALDLAAQRAIEKCRFRPALVDGIAQASTAQVRFSWKLQD